MIQFHRYRLADEPSDLHADIVELVGLMTSGFTSRPIAGVPKLIEMGKKYVENPRVAAIAARLYFWGVLEWSDIKSMLPREMPKNFFYAQEIAGCIGFERAHQLWSIEENDWRTLQAHEDDIIWPGASAIYGYRCYRPQNSGFFSVIENIIAAHIVAEQDGYRLKVDLSGNWWSYDEPFETIFRDIFEFCNGGLPVMNFNHMRQRFFDADITQARGLIARKTGWYREVHHAISNYAMEAFERDIGTMFLRGGDKLQLETILPPLEIIHKELSWMGRHCRERVLLSDDPVLAEVIAAREPGIINRSDRLESGYHHLPQTNHSCLPILKNYLAMVDAKHNFSCPSSNLVNAAQWSREDVDNLSLSNPVYRYLLI